MTRFQDQDALPTTLLMFLLYGLVTGQWDEGLMSQGVDAVESP
ncbi:hypothetical protein [Leptolyngbya sp. Heron Island J]|nr:hypothetical protein [Leptolyngbya sp. Heron Island J]